MSTEENLGKVMGTSGDVRSTPLQKDPKEQELKTRLACRRHGKISKKLMGNAA